MDFSKLDSFLDLLVNEKGVPGVDCSIHMKGEEIYRHMAGYSDIATGRKMSEDDLFFMYSVTKVITCTAAMQLYEKGKFLLNDPLYEYLPEYKEMKKVVRDEFGGTSTVPAQKPILIGHLFSMTSGIDYEKSSRPLKKLYEENPNYTTREFAAALAKNPLRFEPGTHWLYSWAHDVIGALIEVISGKKLSEYMQENIFGPLHMDDTYFRLPEEKKYRLGTMYAFDDETNSAHEIDNQNKFQRGDNYESGGAGLITSVNDYSKFASAMSMGGTSKDGYRIISSNTIDLMRTNRLDERVRKDFCCWPQNSGFGYGLGVRTAMYRAEGGYNGSLGAFGWGGAAGAYAHIDPELQMSVFYAQHMQNNKEGYIHPRLRNIIYSCL